MKTNQIFSALLVLIFLSSSSQLIAQNLIEPIASDYNFSIPSEQIDLRTYELDVTSFELQYDVENAPKSITENDAQANTAVFALSMIAFGAGLGLSEFETLWCLHAAYYLRLAMFKKSALYAAGGIGYNGINGDNIVTSLFDISLKLLMFTMLTKAYQQVRLQYGIFGKYIFGNHEYDGGYKTDVTILSLGILVGLHILLSPQWSLMVQTELLSHREQTNKSEGFEVKDSTTYGLINKNNLLLFSLVFTLPHSKR